MHALVCPERYLRWREHSAFSILPSFRCDGSAFLFSFLDRHNVICQLGPITIYYKTKYSATRSLVVYMPSTSSEWLILAVSNFCNIFDFYYSLYTSIITIIILAEIYCKMRAVFELSPASRQALNYLETFSKSLRSISAARDLADPTRVTRPGKR